MNSRERFLSILVGGLMITAAVWWGLGKYKTANQRRNNEIANLQNTQERLHEQRMQGEYANRQMGEYLIRSLPGNRQKARSQYKAWLLSLLQKHELTGRSVDPTSSRKTDDVYQEFTFRVQGRTSQEQLVRLMYDFYAKDYLHRIRNLSIRPTRDSDFAVEMTVDVLALDIASESHPEPTKQSYRVENELSEYRDAILNRNFFSPPNQAPRYEGNAQLSAIVGKPSTFSLVFKDQENQALSYKLISPNLSGQEDSTKVSLDARSGTLQVQSENKQPIELIVRVSDNGFPKRHIDQKLSINIVDPPPPPKPEPPKLAFDDAKQTVLTALVQGRKEWTAWMHVRTRGKTLKLRAGDAFDIGTVKGKVIEVTNKYAKLEIDGTHYELHPSEKLAELVAP